MGSGRLRLLWTGSSDAHWTDIGDASDFFIDMEVWAIEGDSYVDHSDQARYGAGAEMVSIHDGTEHEDVEAVAQACANQARAFAEARKLLNDVRIARGYYPVVWVATIPDSGRGKSGQERARERTGRVS